MQTQIKSSSPYNTLAKASKSGIRPANAMPVPSQAKKLRNRAATNPTKGGLLIVKKTATAARLKAKLAPSYSGERTPANIKIGTTRPGISLMVRQPAVIKKAMSASKKRGSLKGKLNSSNPL